MTDSFETGFRLPADWSGPALWFFIQEGQLLVNPGSGRLFPVLDAPETWQIEIVRPHYIGLFNGQACFAADVRQAPEPTDGWRWSGLRSLFDEIPAELLPVASRALQVVEWDRAHQFCGRDGKPTEMVEYERARRCPQCQAMYYPRLNPAIMVLVRREQQLLLARSPHFKPGMYSALAGFVEPGESLEDTVVREVFEEVGIKVGNLQYFASQSWPFPHSLMLAFTADYLSGDLTPDAVEIEDAQWFSPDVLPELPHPRTLSRQLINATLARMQKG